MRAIVIGVLALTGLILSLWRLEGAAQGIRVEHLAIGTIPAAIHHPPPGSPPAPVVVIAHGFAGSGRIMDSFALTAARAGHVAVTYDLAGHGANPVPLTGSITDVEGATMTLVRELQAVIAAGRPLGDGRVALVGHSMSSDIVVRAAKADPAVGAVIAVSMFSPEVTESEPANLLVVTGQWEPGLREEARRVAGLMGAMGEGETVGSPGNWRRAAVAPHVEHASVLFSTVTMAEMVDWLALTFDLPRPAGVDPVADRGGWILLMLVSGVALCWPLARLLPLVRAEPQGAGLGWRRLWPVVAVPVVVVPLALWPLPTGFLPVLVADYLAVHLAAYGLATALMLRLVGAPLPRLPLPAVLAGLIAAGFVALILFLPLDRYFTRFTPGPGRGPVTAVLLAGAAIGLVPLAWAGAGVGAGRLAPLALKAGLFVSLLIAVALDFERLFFLLIILPLMVLFFAVFGLMSHWVTARVRHALPAAIMGAFAFGWALAMTFPLLGAGG